MADSLSRGGAAPRRFNKTAAAMAKALGGASSFESTFNLKIAKMKVPGQAPSGALPAPSKKPMYSASNPRTAPSATKKAPAAGATAQAASAGKRKAAGPPPFSSPPPASKARVAASTAGTPSTAASGTVKAALSASPSGEEYASRTNAGRVEQSLQPILPIPSGVAAASPDAVTVTKLPGGLSHQADKPYRFMLTRLDQRAAALEERVLAMEALCAERKWNLTPVGVASQGSVIVVGRICPMESGRLDKRGGIVLEGSRRTSNGARVVLDVKELKTYNLFPGQVVAVEGICTMGTTIVAKRIMEGLCAPMVRSKPKALREARTLRVWAAAGPFTLASDLKYTPLKELLAETIEAAQPPDVIVLTGPFVDAAHPAIKSGVVETVSNGATFSLTYAELFEQHVEAPIAAYLDRPELSTCHVVLLPSVDDAHVVPVLPQPPMPKLFASPDAEVSASVRARVHCMPNPCTFVVNGVTVGASSVDYLRHGLSAALTRHPGPKPPHMFVRIAETMLNQRSFYPLYPPPVGVPLELTTQKALGMAATPDIMIVPSGVAYFCKKLKNNKIVAVNPGRLTKNNSAGTYARLTIYPLPPDRVDRLEAAMPVPGATKTGAASDAGAAGAGSGAGAGAGAGAGTLMAAAAKLEADGLKVTDRHYGVLSQVASRTRVEIVRI